MVLPVCMDDPELFPKNKRLAFPDKPAKLLPDEFLQMCEKLPRIWWSRLIIAVRGYVANYVEADDEALFLVDDAFILLHQQLVESSSKNALQLLVDLETIVNVKFFVDVLSGLNKGDLKGNPFVEEATKDSFQRVFGEPNPETYRAANSQKYAYITFMDIFSTIQQRWLAQSKKQKGIRFEKDPEWMPDDRVVLFQHFFEGNRTWVLTDFDRHILNYWRPNGSTIIFGDRFIQDKREEGYRLCDYCGMLEQHVGQFAGVHGKCFCTQDCLRSFVLAEQNGGA